MKINIYIIYMSILKKISEMNEFEKYSKLYDNITLDDYDKYNKFLNFNKLFLDIHEGTENKYINPKLYAFIKNFYKFLNYKHFVSISTISGLFVMLKYNKNMLIITSFYQNVFFINQNTNDVPFDAIVYDSGQLIKEYEDRNNENIKKLANVRKLHGTFSVNRDYNDDIVKSYENKYDNIIIQTATNQYERLTPIYYAIIAPDMFNDIVFALNSLKNNGTILLALRVSIVIPSIKKLMHLLGGLFENFKIVEKGKRKRTINIELNNFKRTQYEKHKTNLFNAVKEITKHSFEIKKYSKIVVPSNIFYENNKVETNDTNFVYDFNLEIESNKNGELLIDIIKKAYIDYISDINKNIVIYLKDSNIDIEGKIYEIIQELIINIEKYNVLHNKYYLSLLEEFKGNTIEYLFKMDDNINFSLLSYDNLKNSNIINAEKYSYEMFDKLYAKISVVKKSRHAIISIYDNDVTNQIIRIIEDFTRGINHYIHDKFKMNFPVSNAFVKLWEIYSICDLNKPDLNTFHFCEAPGQFIKCTQHYILKKLKNTNHKWWANSLNPFNKTIVDKYGSNLFKDHFGLMKNNKDNWIWGADNTGDITKPANIKWYRHFFMKNSLDLVTGDGGLSTSDNEFLVLQKLDFAQFVMTVAVSTNGGQCIIKTFTPYSSSNANTKNAMGFFVGLMYLYVHFFETVNLFKPYSSKSSSGEFYIIGKKFKGIDEATLKTLYGILDDFKENQTFFSKDKIPDAFVYQIYEFMKKMTELNVSILERINFFMTCKLDDDKILREETKCMDYLDKKFLDNFSHKRYNMWIEKFKFE
jgi:hypothetical protein